MQCRRSMGKGRGVGIGQRRPDRQALEFLFPGDDAAVELVGQLRVAPPTGVQEVQSVRHHAGVEALATHVRLLKLKGS